ncbi:DNA primase [Tistlia consotensis]|uniref:DNA primase n=1 Tax=Tistlia consotensis USBA 355 TaxID=560819 RepID=A0A1Y6CS12_9PROT|nr:DNA primase [Tistlia consotensis]SMF75356.1 DNA primase [Tistlia consotensis USBA 355]SNS08347.1 DNA primase [Tistlia consotensis]
MSFDPNFLDRLRDQVSIAEVVGRRVRLIRKGREHSGLCPFHNEKTPSFTVSEDKGFFHCFGCGAHGDVIGFVMKTEGLSFPEAVEKLAGEANLPLPKRDPREAETRQRRTDLHEALEEACRWFEEQLQAPGGAEARAYLQGRGLSAATLRDFRLGFAPDQRGALRKALNARGVDDGRLLEAGLVKRPEGAGPDVPLRDYFFNRVIFPIPDRRGRIIAFGGRTLSPDAKPKYVNSPDSPLFHKGRVLYNMARARQAAHDGNALIVAEGYMDVIALAQAGFSGAVAPLGTAITEEQIAELWRMAPEPVVCLDGDAAGQRAAQRAVERALPALRPGCSLGFATLPAGEDPDSLIASQGAAAMARVLAAAQPLAEVLWTGRLAAGRSDTPERRAALRQELMAAVERIQDPGVRQEYRQEMLRRFDEAFGFKRRSGRELGREPGRGRGAGRWDQPEVRPAPPRQAPSLLRRRPEQVLLALAVAHPDAALERIEELAAAPLQAPDHRRLREALVDWLAEAGDLDSSALQCHLRGQGFSGLLDGLSGPQIYLHESLARPEAPPRDVRKRIGYWILRVRENSGGRPSLAPGLDETAATGQGGEAQGAGTATERAMAEESTAQQRVIERFDTSEVAD